MDPITQQTVLAAAGAGGDKVYVDDVFSTFLYEGNGVAQTINNGIDLAGEGGMVWIKNRESQYYDHQIADTERGNQYYLRSDSANGQNSGTTALTSFNNNGFSVGVAGNFNLNNNDHVSWTFRKAPGFFDVVTYTGTGSTRTVAHNLGSVPGMILCKPTSATGSWRVYHQNVGNDKELVLNSTQAESGSAAWDDTTPTSNEFTVSANDVNASGVSYVAYIFAHDDAQFGTDEDESIIKCGSFTHSTSSGNEINLGFEPQWLLYKKTSGTSHWYMWDTMRGWDVTSQSYLTANQANAEGTGSNTAAGWPQMTSTGFKVGTNNYAGDNATYIYMAIRRPNKPPEAATDVFNAILRTGTGSEATVNVGFAPDLLISSSPSNANHNHAVFDRLRGVGAFLATDDGNQEFAVSTNGLVELGNTSYTTHANGYFNNSGSQLITHVFKRAPGFMDVVAYKANNNTAFNVNHNLGVAPELVIIKNRDTNYNWLVGSSELTAWGNYGLRLNTNEQENTGSNYFTGAPTSTQIKLGTSSDGNYGTDNFIAYLFATLPGISKVGSYSGNTSNAVDVDCGFTAGARFVLIKRTDSTGDWYVWDTERGIVSGDDPYFVLNTYDIQVTNTDYIDPLNAGFTVTSSAPAALNVSGGTYLFLAIA